MERNCNSDMSEELQKQYYLIRFKILQETYYAIWYTDDIDGVLLDKDGMLRSFPTKEEAMAFAREEGLLINTKEDEFLLSSAILRKKNIRKINCSLFLNYWNLFSDIAHSMNCKFIGDSREEHIRHIYEKLFYGCNILLKENEEPYRPKWSKKEKCLIASVMKNGFKILSKGLHKS